MPDRNRCVPRSLIALAALVPAAPAAAEEVRTRLIVSATVLPTCRIASAPGGAAIDCPNAPRPAQSVEQEPIPKVGAQRSSARPRTAATTMVTVTY